MKRTLTRILFLLVLMAGIAGCGKSDSSVTGEVKYKGHPLPSGTITFLSQSDHKQVASADIVDGHYTIPSIEPGPVKVTVVTVPPSKGGQPPHGKAIETPGASESAKQFERIPAKFANQDQSGLTYEVISGPQTKDFELTP
jgi:hypothetical protein